MPPRRGCANRLPDWPACAPAGRRASVIPARPAQAELRGIAARLGETEMADRVAGQEPPARGALDEALLDQERLDDLLDGVARLRQGRRDGLDPDRAAAVIDPDRAQI